MLQALKRIVRRHVPVLLRERISLWRQRGPLALGRGSHVHWSVQILGRRHVRIGENSGVSERCWLNVNHPLPGGFAITIGDHTFIGRDNFMSSGRSIRIGHYCLTTLGCKFICSTHIADTPNSPIIATGTTAADEIRVGDNCFFGVNAMVLGNVDIGHGCVIGAGAVLTADVPPFSLVIGNPARVIKHYSFRRGAWIAVDALQPGDMDDNPDALTYLARLRSTHPQVDMPWVALGADLGSL
ncbi:acyltransferase [Roseateles amylovorans]|uniref:acyltransferase n=1 Tax=Roseateles amylovorans TaxID=2978473 RepID=UPI0025B676F0|nr:acyltransferase [Roseateles amylovorans]